MDDLYKSDLSRWNPSERINDTLYPANIGTFWTDEELAVLGLYRPLPADAIPEGKQIVSTSLAWVDGRLQFVHILEDIPIVFPDLTSRQLWTALATLGHYEEVEAAIAALPLVDRVEAQKATTFQRYHSLIVQMSPILDLTEAQIDDIWLWASTL